MTYRQTIDMLRFALAAAWTECEKDSPNLDDVQTIANEALAFTTLTGEHKNPANQETGLASWTQYLQDNGRRP